MYVFIFTNLSFICKIIDYTRYKQYPNALHVKSYFIYDMQI